MTNILSEINRVREIMGVKIIQEQIDDDRLVPSPEITAWANAEIENIQRRIDEGPNDTWSGQDIEDFKEELIRIQQDPVAYVIAEKEKYCEWAEEGDAYWVPHCQEMTELLATTIPVEDPTTGTTATTTGTTETTGTTVTQMPITRDPFRTTGSTGTIAGELPRSDEKKRKEKEKKEKEPTAKQMAKELKTAWKKEVFEVLDSINSGDVFGFKEVYSLQKTDKLHALLKMLQNIMCINAKIAKIAILTQYKSYDSSKLIDTAIMPVGEGHEGLINTIKNNMGTIDDKFKIFRGGRKIDKKLKPIRNQLNQARATINELVRYVNWNEAKDILGFDARTTEDIFLNSKDIRKLHLDCADELGSS